MITNRKAQKKQLNRHSKSHIAISEPNEDLIGKLIKHVHEHPAFCAVMTSNGHWTYQQLYDHVLRAKSLFSNYPHGRVVVCLKRSPYLLSVLLALHWLEMPYIPVDPNNPLDWIKTIVEDSKAEIVVSDGPNHPMSAMLPCIHITLADIEQCAVPAHELSAHSLPRQTALAYIIYTSGSTGKPKGVAISRRALNNFLTSMSRYFLHEDSAMLLAITTIAFDIAGLELFLPVWQHKTLFLANDQEHKDPYHIIRILTNQPITLLQATPGMWTLLDSAGWQGKPNLVALCGGESLTKGLAESILPKVSELWNMYGPTEATIWCSLKKISRNEPITIGYPIDNMQMDVLDDNGLSLPPYAKGELYISGIGLAEGYIHHKQLTRTKFIADDSVLGGRRYQVGDIACRTPENEFILFGRTDNQIKLHGYRIELECIEAQLIKLPGVQNCVVTLYQEKLIAFVALQRTGIYSESSLLKHLRYKLPEYMLPNRIEFLDTIPLTPNGKVDRSALPAPKVMTTVTSKAAPLTPLQQLLTHIWAEAFQLPHVSPHDGFFALGGHSLIAVKIISQIYERTGKRVPLSAFYQAINIAQLEQLVETTPKSKMLHTKSSKEIRVFDGRWLPLNDFQLLLWCIQLFAPDAKAFNVTARRRVQGPLDKKGLDFALKFVFQSHEVFSYNTSYFRPIHKQQTKSLPNWQEITLIKDSQAKYESYLAHEFKELNTYHNWSKHKAFLLARLFYLPDDVVEMHLCMPHIISDEDSLTILFNELSEAYLFYTQQAPLPGALNALSYSACILKQQEKTRSNLKQAMLFWKQYLQDAGFFPVASTCLMNNADKRKGSYSTYFALSDSFIKHVKNLCSRHQISVNDLFAAAVAQALCSVCGMKTPLPHKMMMSSVRSAREHACFEEEIGCFLQVQTFKLDLNCACTLIDLAKRAQQSMLETFNFQSVSSFIKLAAIGQLKHKKSLKHYLVKAIVAFMAAWFKRYDVPPDILKSCASMASIEREHELLVDLNILNNFFAESDKQLKAPLFGVQSVTYPLCSSERSTVDGRLEVCLLRESHQPYLVISANLKQDIREKLSQNIINLIRAC